MKRKILEADFSQYDSLFGPGDLWDISGSATERFIGKDSKCERFFGIGQPTIGGIKRFHGQMGK